MDKNLQQIKAIYVAAPCHGGVRLLLEWIAYQEFINAAWRYDISAVTLEDAADWFQLGADIYRMLGYGDAYIRLEIYKALVNYDMAGPDANGYEAGFIDALWEKIDEPDES